MPLRYNRTRKARRSRRRSFLPFSAKTFSPKYLKRQLIYLFTTKEGLKKTGTVFGIGAGLMLGLFGWYAKDLPTPNKINSRFSAQTTQIFDRNGRLLYEMHGDKNRILVEFDDIPKNVKNATIAVEDKNFYKHKGLSPTRIVGSAIYNFFRRATGSNLQGGSTITQQFVKNALLSPEQTYSRKIKELILSMEIEAMYKKDDILKMYLNEIPYGSNAYGVKVAAKTYFNKELNELTLEEAATLAAIPQAPTYYSPYGQHKDDLLARKDLVLSLMANQGYISQEEAKAAQEKPIKFSNNPYGSITAPHWVMYVREQLVEKYGEKKATEGGLKVYTSLDLNLQEKAEAAVKAQEKKLTSLGASNASLVSIDPKTGQVLAMVGSRDFFNQDIDGNVNVALMNRQPGSSFKPFAYATAWKTGSWGPGSTMYDFKTDFGGGYIPSNYDGKDHGIQSMRSSLAGSLNIPAVKTLYIAGIDETIKTASDLGITTLTDRDKYGLSLVLGAGEVKPLEMAAAYGVFANNGVRQDLSWYVKIEDAKGKTIDEYKKKNGQQVLDPQISYLMSNVLSDNNARSYVFGSRNSLTLPDRPVAAKTGTTNDNKDAWTVGYTPNLVTAVWAGNNNNKKMKAGGSMAAAPIWQNYMKEASKAFPKEEFKRPSGIKTVTVDAITGRKTTSATKQTRTDVFPSWYKTPEVFGQSQEVKVDKLTGKLATEKCPAELVETRIYSPITAEIPPKDPAFTRWNAPIQKWAASHGYATDTGGVPTESCDLHNGESLPDLTFLSPTNGSSINSKTFKVKISVSTTAGFESLTVSVDGKSYSATAQGSYYEANVTVSSSGSYKITAKVTDKLKQTKTEEVTVSVTASSPLPIQKDPVIQRPKKQPAIPILPKVPFD